MKNKKGFTLAEVLIVLGIIGIVAQVTLPSLVKSYQKTIYVSSLKKAYTEFNQALIQIAADNGCVGDLACTGFFADNNWYALYDEMVKHFKVVKECRDMFSRGCLPDSVSQNYDRGGPWPAMTSSDFGISFVTASGAAYGLWNAENGANCTKNLSVNGDTPEAKTCAYVTMDVNGAGKGPNNYGRDIFFFNITNAKGPQLSPYGA